MMQYLIIIKYTIQSQQYSQYAGTIDYHSYSILRYNAIVHAYTLPAPTHLHLHTVITRPTGYDDLKR